MPPGGPRWARHPKAFAQLVAGMPTDAAAHARALAAAPPDRAYVILFTPRSGSTWLALTLEATGRLGKPFEHLHPDAARIRAEEAATTDPAGALAVLQRRHQTANGVFGIKLRALDIHLFGADPFFAALGPPARYFCLWRDNVVAQGVSLYRAVASGRWHSYEADQAAPEYDAAAIQKWVAHVVQIENQNRILLRERQIRAVWMRYEDIVEDPRGTLARVARAVGETLPADLPAPALSRLADDWNIAAEARFRAERPDAVAALEARRLVKRMMLRRAARSSQ